MIANKKIIIAVLLFGSSIGHIDARRGGKARGLSTVNNEDQIQESVTQQSKSSWRSWFTKAYWHNRSALGWNVLKNWFYRKKAAQYSTNSSPTSYNTDDQFTLHKHIEQKKSAEVIKLIDELQDPQKQGSILAKNKDEKTPLYLAAQHGLLDVVQKLVENGALEGDNLRNNGLTPLHAAAGMGHLDIVQYLIKQKKEWLAAKTNDNFTTPLHTVAMFGPKNTSDIIKALVNASANVDSQAQYNVTPAYLAVQQNKKEALIALIENNAAINIPDEGGNTPLHIAAHNNNEELVKLLVNNNADVTAKNNKNQIPYQVSANSETQEILSPQYELKIEGGANKE